MNGRIREGERKKGGEKQRDEWKNQRLEKEENETVSADGGFFFGREDFVEEPGAVMSDTRDLGIK